MAEKRKTSSARPRKQSRFALGLTIYLWILLILGAGALVLLRDFLLEYEKSRPVHFVEEYARSLGETVPEAALLALDGVDPQILGDEAKAAWVQSLLQEAELSKDPTQSWEDHQVYRILSGDGRLLGSVVFEPTGAARFRMPVWGVKEERFDFSPYYRTAEITVPADYQVFLGERRLGPECIVEEQIPYALLKECYLHYSGLPTMVRYETMPFVGEVPLRVFDSQGREIPPEELNEEAFLDRCPQEVRELAQVFVPRFVELYVFFTADIKDSAYYYYEQLLPMVVRPDSQLNERMRMAFESFGYSTTKAVRLDSVEINRIIELGSGLYLADISYTTHVTGQQGPVPVNDHILLVLRMVDGKLLADALYYQ